MKKMEREYEKSYRMIRRKEQKFNYKNFISIGFYGLGITLFILVRWLK